MIIRPVRHDDLNDLYEIACESGPGFTSLMPDKDRLSRKIEAQFAASAHRPSTTANNATCLCLKRRLPGRSWAQPALPLEPAGRNRFTIFATAPSLITPESWGYGAPWARSPAACTTGTVRSSAHCICARLFAAPMPANYSPKSASPLSPNIWTAFRTWPLPDAGCGR